MASSADNPSVAVIGGGIIGLCTAYALLERGAEVRLYEPGLPGNGQSGGESRIFRHAHDDQRLVSFAAEARGIWAEWEPELGVELVSADGVIAIGEAVPGRLELIDAVGGIDAGPLDAGGIAERLPIFAGYDGPAMLDSGGGAIRVRAAVEALTKRLGSDLIPDEVISVRPDGDGVEVRTGGASDRFDAAVVCAGRETARIARSNGEALPVELAAHLRATFRLRGEAPDRLPCFQDGSGAFGETGIYAAPLPGNELYAVGLAGTIGVNEDGSVRDPAELAELERRASTYVEHAFPGLDPAPVELRHCWVTTLPWGEDGVAAWQRGPIIFVAGHNLFKQAPRLGRSLAASALDGREVEAVLSPASRLGEPE